MFVVIICIIISAEAITPFLREVNAVWVNTQFSSAKIQSNSVPQKTSVQKMKTNRIKPTHTYTQYLFTANA